MKRKVNIFIIMLIIFSLNTNTYYASSGALKSSSIKTCPNGKTYGYHGKDNHWHEAKYTPREKGSNYTAIGSPIYSDPCPFEKYENNSIEEITSTQQNNDEVNNKEEQEVIQNSENNSSIKEENTIITGENLNSIENTVVEEENTLEENEDKSSDNEEEQVIIISDKNNTNLVEPNNDLENTSLQEDTNNEKINNLLNYIISIGAGVGITMGLIKKKKQN